MVSQTKGKKTKKISRAETSKRLSSKPAEESQTDLAIKEKPLPKTNLTPEQLGEFKQLLLSKRAQLAGDVRQLADEALNRSGANGADGSSMPIHMADLGSDNWEQEFTLGLLANERSLVHEIDKALARIENKTYGICLATHKRIRIARLRAKPWAKYSIDHARLRDAGRGR